MRDFNVRMDEIDDMLSRLYEFCGDQRHFTVKGNLIEVFKKLDEHSAQLVAKIRIVATDEPYQVIDELKTR